MDSEARHPDIPGRLRVVDLRIGSERRQLHFGGGFACVLVAGDARAAARWIATTIVGPPPAVSDGLPVGADQEPVWRLQSPLLPLRAPAVLDRELLQTIWRSDCARRFEVIATSREAIQLERRRIHGALERARIQPPLSAAAAATRARSGEADEDLANFKASARRFVRVQSLLGEIDSVVPGVSPEALELADLWDAHLASPPLPAPGQIPAAGQIPSDARRSIEYLPIEAVSQAVTAAPAQPPPPPPSPRAAHAGVPATDPAEDARRAEVERLHRDAVNAEAKLFRRGLVPRSRSVARYNDARLREQAALAGAGVDSYSEFLLGYHTHQQPDEETPAEPEASASSRSDPAAQALRTRELREQARVMLGREPSEDVSGDLRSERTDPPARGERVAKLEEVLREEGITDIDDVVARARVFIATPPSVHIPQPPTWAMLTGVSELQAGGVSAIPLHEIEGLERQLLAKDESLRDLESEIAHVVATRDLDLLRLGPDDFVRVIEAMFDAYRAGEVLEGHLPLVLDGVLDGLAGDSRDAGVVALAEVDDIQVIVVTDDLTVSRRVGAAGGTIVEWPSPESERRRDHSR